jgi:leucyl aminopeptidase
MKIRLLTTSKATATIARPVLAGGPIPPWAAGFTAAPGEACEIFLDERCLLLGIGPNWTEAVAERAGALAAARLANVPRIAIDARGLAPSHAVALAVGAALRAWRGDRYRTIPDPEAPKLEALDLLVDDPDEVRPAWNVAKAALRGVLWARRAITEPGNLLTPSRFCDRLEKLHRHGLELRVLTKRDLRVAGLGALLAVGSGSDNPPRLAVLRWKGHIAGDPVVFIGKGITFDTGGICIKPADKMWEMRADMAGAAACVGAMIALARRDSPAPAIAVLPLAENAIGADAYRPGDVLRAADGTTIEVVDTDAEGRLVLADAIAWARQHLHPRVIIDLATLTGSIVTALGHEMAGLFDNDPGLAAHASAAGATVGEKLWRMPIGERHRSDLNSDIADLRHCLSGRLQPDACHAAAFLREFAGPTPWLHLDIAGMDVREKADDRHPAGAIGFGVRLLDRLVAQHFEDVER